MHLETKGLLTSRALEQCACSSGLHPGLKKEKNKRNIKCEQVKEGRKVPCDSCTGEQRQGGPERKVTLAMEQIL